MHIAAQFCCTQFLLHAVCTAQSFAACSCFCRQLCCESTRLDKALQRFTARSLVHMFLMHAGLMHRVLLRYSTTRLLYSYITTQVLHYYATATLLPLCYTTATCNYTLWLHYDTTATLHLHCELTLEMSRVCRVEDIRVIKMSVRARTGHSGYSNILRL